MVGSFLFLNANSQVLKGDFQYQRWVTLGFHPIPHQGVEHPGPAIAEFALKGRESVVPAAAWRYRGSQASSRCASGPAAFSRQTGCKASGEMREKSGKMKAHQTSLGEKTSLLGLSFSRFTLAFPWARSPQTFRSPSVTAGTNIFRPLKQLRLNGSRGRSPLAQSLRPRRPQRSHTCWFLA